MANPGVNRAITKDGGTYNKLQRPDNYLMPTTSNLPSLVAGGTIPPPSSKRKRADDVVPGVKRARPEGGSATGNRDYGMRAMLPAAEDEEQISDDSTSEALAYLRSVRSEASAIPTLLVAPKVADIDEHYESSPYIDESDTQGLVYKDGIWISVDEEYEPAYEEDDWNEENDEPGAQATCYAQLLKRFQFLRRQILQANTNNFSGRKNVTTSEHSGSLQPPRSKRAWLQTIDGDNPSIERLHKLDDRALYFGIQSCASSLSQTTTISSEKSCWIWSLLALAGDVGTLDNERISKIRDLGLQAGRMSVRLRSIFAQMQYKDDDIASTGDSGPEDEDCVPHDWEDTIGRSEDMASEALQEQEDERTPELDQSAHRTAGDAQHKDMDRVTSGSDAEMSMSDGEIHVQENQENKELEEARARLLAQLGDRLIQPHVPSSRAEAERLRQQKQEVESANGSIQHIQDDSHVSHRPDASSVAQVDVDWNTRVTIDMILTVVAECYGQKDLLQYREAW